MRKTVYLDSHLISRAVENKGWLFEEISTGGNADFVFSAVHYMEAMPKEGIGSIGRGLSRQRLELIYRCQAKLFVIPPHKILALSKNIRLNNVTCELRYIFGDMGLSFSRKEMLEDFSRKIQGDPRFMSWPRQRRRKLLAGINPNKKIKDEEIVEFIEKANSEISRSLARSAPQLIPIFGDGGFYDWLMGRVSDREFGYIMGDCLVRPDVFCFIDFNDLEIAELISKFRGILESNIESMRVRAERMLDNFMSVSLSNSVPPKKIRSHIEKLLFSSAALGEYVENKDINVISLRVFMYVILNKVFDDIYKDISNQGRKGIARNDVCDAMHALYYPYVDIFCCDGSTKNILDKYRYQYGKICRNESELKALLKADS